MKKNNELIKCKIKEIGLDEVKYLLPEYSQDVILSIDKDDIIKIIFENGKEMEFQQKMTNPETYSENKKNILKIDFLSPLQAILPLPMSVAFVPAGVLKPTWALSGLVQTQAMKMPVAHLLSLVISLLKILNSI
ncbi:MAG: hypothetical protein IPF68_18285 [Bacteroidales bacterium]|nr:hypothetical protein [Bacteroidales bacterium]